MLEVTQLSKSFGDLKALDGVDLTVGRGEIVGFVGSNGAGKSTLMRIVLGVLSPDAGTTTWDGQPLDLASRRQIGYMPEERGLYPRMKVGDQLVYLARLHGLSAADAAAAADRWTDRLGISERRKDDVIKLSLGNQQRVQLAAALVHDPMALVLDEPFSGLDPVAVDVMSAVLRERAAAGVPTLFSSHQLDLVERLCDRVTIIRSGRLVANGTIAELRGSAPARWAVDVPDAPPGWAPPGTTVISREGSRLVVEPIGGPSAGTSAGPTGATASTDEAGQRVLQAALATGTVREFAPELPHLVDLYRHAVSDDTTPAGSGSAAAGTSTSGSDSPTKEA